MELPKHPPCLWTASLDTRGAMSQSHLLEFCMSANFGTNLCDMDADMERQRILKQHHEILRKT